MQKSIASKNEYLLFHKNLLIQFNYPLLSASHIYIKRCNPSIIANYAAKLQIISHLEKESYFFLTHFQKFVVTLWKFNNRLPIYEILATHHPILVETVSHRQLPAIPCLFGKCPGSLAEEDREKQPLAPWQEYLKLSEMEDFEQTSWEDYEEELEELAQHPLNLNTATREEMEHLPFLTPSQVEDIQAYVYRYHGMKTMAELALIPSISWYQRQLMNSFFYVADDSPQAVSEPEEHPEVWQARGDGNDESAFL